MTGSWSRTIPADLDRLRGLNTAFAEFLGLHRVPDGASHAAQLVCEEIVANVITHGCRSIDPAACTIRFQAEIDAGIAIRIEDDAPPFDPTSVGEPDVPGGLQDALPGGLGLPLLRRLTSSFTWRREDGRNVIEATVPLAWPA